MPYEFLNDQHLAQYGQYSADPTPQQLVDCFRLREDDNPLFLPRMEPHNRLGMAVQLGTLRFLGTFVSDLTTVPKVAVRYVAEQLGLSDLRLLRVYQKHDRTRQKHAEAIRKHLGYKELDVLEVLHLRRLLYAKLLVADERPITLFDLCTRELVGRRVVLPGATTLARLVVEVRERVSQRLYHDLSRRLTDEQRRHLGDLLVPPEAGQGRKTPFDRLRTPPTRVSSVSLVAALERVEAIRAVGVSEVSIQDLPQSRLNSLSKYAAVAWAGQLAKLSRERCQATMLAYVQHLERSATDDALDIFDSLMSSLNLKSQRRWCKERLRSLGDLDASALLLCELAAVYFDPKVPNDGVREAVRSRMSETALREALTLVATLASPEGEAEPQAWQNAKGVVVKFIQKLLTTLDFEATPGGKPLLAAMRWVVGDKSESATHSAKSSGKAAKPSKPSEPPKDFVPRSWEGIVFPKEVLSRPAYLVCLAHQIQQALKRREIYVVRSHQHGDPRARLLQGADWESRRGEVCRALGLSAQPGVEVERLGRELNEAYRQVLDQLGNSEGEDVVRLEDVDGVLTPTVAPLEALPESPSLNELDSSVSSRLPEIDLSELLMGVNAATGFCDSMPLASEGESKIPDLAVSVCAVLVAQACNIGLRAVVQKGEPALSLNRLIWVHQNYVRADTILSANARLVEAHSQLSIVKRWGGGEVASADGLRFVVPVRSIYTGSNSRYFGAQRGVTYYTLTSDQFTMLHGLVAPGTLRDSLYILATLLEQRTALEPKEIMSDTAGYSDVVFGLFRLLGYQFSPRLKDLKDTRYWRIDRNANYGKLNGISKNRINTALIAQHWEDVLRVVGSLKLNAVNATEVMRVLAKDGSLSSLGKAIAEIGRVAKTIYLLEYTSSETYRRRIHTQLNRGESRGQLARIVYHGNRGEVRERFRPGMEDQLGALGFVVNAIAFWNSRYMQAALGMIEAQGER